MSVNFTSYEDAAPGMSPAVSVVLSWLIRVPGNGMKNSPISEASRVAAFALSASAPANNFMSSLPSSTLVSFGGCAAPSCVGGVPSGGAFVNNAWP